MNLHIFLFSTLISFITFSNIYIDIFSKECNGLVLSGGGSYGSYQNGIISNIITNKNYDWNIISGVSSGSINAAYLSQYNTSKELINEVNNMKELWYNLKTKDVYVNDYLLNGISLYDNSILEKTLTNLFPNIYIKNNLLISSTSLASSSKIVWDNTQLQNNLVQSIMASTSLPVLFPPYYFQNQYFVDGAVSSNILLEETIQFCKDNFPKSKIHIDLILTNSYNFDNNKTQSKDSIKNIKDVVYSLLDTVNVITDYNQLSNIKNICKSPKLDITMYERNGIDVDYIDFNQGKKLWDLGFALKNTKIIQLCD